MAELADGGVEGGGRDAQRQIRGGGGGGGGREMIVKEVGGG